MDKTELKFKKYEDGIREVISRLSSALGSYERIDMDEVCSDAQTALEGILDEVWAVENYHTCDTCGEVIEPDYLVDDYSEFGVYFCSEKCMREFENIGK